MLVDVFESVAKQLEAEFDATKTIKHPGIKGENREKMLSRLLQPHLPEKYSMGSGILVDSAGSQSRQQDLVIYDRFNSPVLQDFQNSQVFFLEQVLACIEVKSVLGAKEIKDILTKAESIRGLKPQQLHRVRKDAQGRLNERYLMPVFGFAYRSELTLDRILEVFVENLNEDTDVFRRPNAVCVLSDKHGEAGVVLSFHQTRFNEILSLPSRDSVLATQKFESKGQALLGFYLGLVNALQIRERIIFPPDYFEYAKAAGFGETTTISMGQQDTLPRKAALIVAQASQHTDQEVLDALHILANLPFQSLLKVDPYAAEMRYVYKSQWVTGITPAAIKRALSRRARNSSTARDVLALNNFLKLLRDMHRTESFISVVDTKREVEVGRIGRLNSDS